MADIRLSRDFLRPTFKQAHGLIAAGAPNPMWETLLEIVVDKVINDGETSTGSVTVTDGMNASKWSIDDVVLLCGSAANQWGQNVFGYSAFVKMTLASLSDNVPLYLTAPRFINPDGTNGARKTWEEWQKSIPQTDTHAYIELNGGGAIEDGKTIAKLVADNFNVITPKAAQNQLAAFALTQNP